MKRKIILVVSIISFASWNIIAQTDLKDVGQGGLDIKKTGQTTMNFLQVGVSPKATGFGNAFNALGKGVESIFANPAGLTEMTSDYEAFVSSTSWFADIKYLAGAIAYNAGDYGAIGFSFIVVDYGSIKGTSLLPSNAAGSDPNGYSLTGDVPNVGAYSFGLTYVKQISTKFSIGGTIKYVGQQLGQSNDGTGISDNNQSKLVFDMGVKYFPGIESLRLGMYMRNFSTFVKYQSFSSPLPLVFSLGIGMNIMDFIDKDLSNDHAIMVGTEFVHPNNYTDRVNAGIEYTFMNMISFRAGYETNQDILSWSGGVGVTQTIGGIKFDINYSYSNLEYFDGVNRFSLNFGF